jgi:DNA-binding SARP family transcriptional activator
MQTPMLRIRLFGALELRAGDRLLPAMTSARAEGLLAYLLLHRHLPQSRQHLAFTLWPDSSESQARTNLRHVLHDLRRALPDADRLLEVTPRTLRWREEASYWLDVAAFEDALTRPQADVAEDGLAALREAVELYRGDLLDGSYDEWLLGERERLRSRYLEALERLATRLGEHGDHAHAIGYAERLLHHDPLHEEAYRLLMRLHAGRGQPARALQIYHLCSSSLESELGVGPSPATRDVYEALLNPGLDHADFTLRPQTDRFGGTSLVGRAAEWGRLTTLWHASERGRAQVVLVTGEPGVGKTRLVEEFQAWAARRGAVTATARSYVAEGAVAFGPLVAWLRSAAIAPRLDRLDRAQLAQLAPLLPEVRRSATASPADSPPDAEQRRLLFEAAARAILAAGGPILIVADDLQWCDQETLQFLHFLLRVGPQAPLLVVATARREELGPRHPLLALIEGLLALECFTEIEVGRLTRDEAVHLAEEVAGHPFAVPAAERLFQETEGNPLFLVETLRAGWTADDRPRPMSPKVQAVIESRLAQLSDSTQRLVGVAATIGRAFSPDVLALASGASEDALVRGLDELWRRRIIREQGARAYDFSHDKIREVAYLALSPAQRRHHHGLVAQGLARLHARDLDAVSSEIAAHRERAGQVDQAITWYQRASEAAQKLHANLEAARLLDRALELVRTLPETTERGAREMSILAALPASLGAAEGYASPRLAGVHSRAQELASVHGLELTPPLLRSLAVAGLAESDFGAAQRFGERLLARAERDDDGVLLVEADYVLGIAAFWQGQFEAARGHFESAVERYRPHYRRAHLLQYGLDPKVICLSRLANTLWFLGRPESALRAREAALALADEIGHPYSKATAVIFAALLSLEMKDAERIRAYTAMLTVRLEANEAPQMRVPAAALGGYLDVVAGQAATGLARIQGALDDTRGVQHAPGIRTWVARWLLEACAMAGENQVGLAAADDALATGSTALCEAEFRRLRAEFLSALAAPAHEIEAELDRALQVARDQGALAIALRVATSVLRFQQRRGNGPGVRQASQALQDLLDALPERPETWDTREALALLQSLNGATGSRNASVSSCR